MGARHTLAPVLDVARDPRWGRVEETYGEDPGLCGTIGCETGSTARRVRAPAARARRAADIRLEGTIGVRGTVATYRQSAIVATTIVVE